MRRMFASDLRLIDLPRHPKPPTEDKHKTEYIAPTMLLLKNPMLTTWGFLLAVNLH